jgi:hypothetical protein
MQGPNWLSPRPSKSRPARQYWKNV